MRKLKLFFCCIEKVCMGIIESYKQIRDFDEALNKRVKQLRERDKKYIKQFNKKEPMNLIDIYDMIDRYPI